MQFFLDLEKYWFWEVAAEAKTSLRTSFNSWYESRQFDDVPDPAPPGILSIISVVVELHHAIYKMQQRRRWPRFLLESKDKGLARHLSSEEGYFEAGNLVWENLYWLGGVYLLPTGTGVAADVERNARIPTDEYGTASNKSSKGIFNAHGNTIESMFGWLYKNMQTDTAEPAHAAKKHRRVMSGVMTPNKKEMTDASASVIGCSTLVVVTVFLLVVTISRSFHGYHAPS